MAYFAGGTLGLALLLLRAYVHESGMFSKTKESKTERGNFFSLFTNRKRFVKYIACILTGVPVWFVIGILVTFSKEFGEYLHVKEPISAGKSVMYHYIGASIGSILTGFISQKLRSRKKALLIALLSLAVFCTWYFLSFGVSAAMFYFVVFAMGIAMGYWAVFVTVASEQFGTNIRSTVTTSVSNFVRGATILMTLWWSYMSAGMGIWKSAIIVGGVVIALAIGSVVMLQETYGKELDYSEE